MAICIIGAGGFLGQAVSREYNRRNIETKKYSSKDQPPLFSSAGLINQGFQIPADCECIIYLAQSPYYRNLPARLEHVWNVNVVSAMTVARLACDAGVKRIIYTSTGTVYAPSFSSLNESSPVRRDNWYALSKLHAEEGLMLFQDKLEISILRFFGLYGSGQADKLIPCLINKVIAGSPVYIERSDMDKMPSQGLRISMCHVDDAANIIADLAGIEGCGIMNVASDETLSIRNIACQIAENMKLESKFAEADNTRQGDLIANTDKLKKIISPAFRPFADGLRDMLSTGRPGLNN